MAKTSSQFLRKRGGWFSWRVFIYVFFAVLIFGACILWRAQLERLVWSVFLPIERARVSFGTSENEILRAELASTTALVADRDALYAENQELKARLNRNGSKQVIVAGVIMRPPAIPYDTLLVDAGESEGVAMGALVYASGTTLVGKVGDVYGHSARIVLLSAPGEVYDALLRGQVPVQMQGQGSGSFVGQVPAGTHVAEGDSLVFPGVVGGFAGTVSNVVARDGESFETLYAHLPVDPLLLRFVEIDKYATQ
ncbi:MAG TPA: rod shape-determining protein MreC [Candidatus Paceibacterota bacterium]|nr:rod shape-determining protein MreC [Candidatus Paceibacterota bacterium]